MVFSSIVFLFYFLAPLLVLYFVVPKKAKNTVLFIASLVFYAWGEPKYVLLMLFSAVFNYASGLVIDKFRPKKWPLVLNIVVNIGILVFFKYTDFILSWVRTFAPESIPIFNIALPIGISFYTFQALSYTIDVYRRDTEVQKNFLSFGLYLSLFPQLIAGPIVRYDDVAKQLKNRTVTGEKFVQGFTRFCAGLCKKVLIANNVGRLWTMVSGYEYSHLPASLAWLGIFSFSMQIYFDFSGYSDMAIGLGKMFGFDFLENFDYPYASRSITEFWRRWHISLGTWFREYVYIPLGGNRKGRLRTYINLLIVWMLTGLWHGAEWNFVLWGLYYAVLLMIEKGFLLKVLEKNRVIAFVYSAVAVTVGWVIFSVTDVGNIIHYVGAMFNVSNLGLENRDFLYNVTSYGVVFIIAIVTALGFSKKIYTKLIPERFTGFKYVFAVLGFILCVAYLVDETYNPFLYFRF
ncbi:MAG: MBOAT family protein [Clostridiales bacterium]|nr:MBOAT family protein [Clostridiales bacterium]